MIPPAMDRRLPLVLLLVVIMLVAHPIGAWIMLLFGLKDRVG